MLLRTATSVIVARTPWGRFEGAFGALADGMVGADGGPMAWVEKLRSCIDWNEEDQARLADVRALLLSEREETVQDLGERLVASNGTQALIANARFIRRLHGLLDEWLTGLLGGAFDEAYVERRRSLGQELADVDLTFEDVILLEGMARQRIFELAQRRLDARPQRLSSMMHTLDKALSRDLALIYEGYLDVRDAEMEQTLLDRFLAITGFSPTLYDSLAEARRWDQGDQLP
jgi:hypothetical protein